VAYLLSDERKVVIELHF